MKLPGSKKEGVRSAIPETIDRKKNMQVIEWI